MRLAEFAAIWPGPHDLVPGQPLVGALDDAGALGQQPVDGAVGLGDERRTRYGARIHPRPGRSAIRCPEHPGGVSVGGAEQVHASVDDQW